MSANPIVEQGPNLTLFELDESLLLLLEAREELAAELAGQLDADRRAERQSELVEVERLLIEYRAQLPAKVDRVRGLILHAQTAAAAHRQEAARQLELARNWEAREERIKLMVHDAIEAVPDRKRLNGSHGYMLLKGNGGLAPLVVGDPAQVPEEYCKYVGWIGGALWKALDHASNGLLGDPLGGALWNDFKVERTVDNDRARKAISELGGVPGAHLGERGKHVEIK